MTTVAAPITLAKIFCASSDSTPSLVATPSTTDHPGGFVESGGAFFSWKSSCRIGLASPLPSASASRAGVVVRAVRGDTQVAGERDVHDATDERDERDDRERDVEATF